MKKNKNNEKIICRAAEDNQILINADGVMMIGCKFVFDFNHNDFKGIEIGSLIKENKKKLEVKINNDENQRKKCFKCCSLAFKKQK
jgi:hypothetical protein